MNSNINVSVICSQLSFLVEEMRQGNLTETEVEQLDKIAFDILKETRKDDISVEFGTEWTDGDTRTWFNETYRDNTFEAIAKRLTQAHDTFPKPGEIVASKWTIPLSEGEENEIKKYFEIEKPKTLKRNKLQNLLQITDVDAKVISHEMKTKIANLDKIRNDLKEDSIKKYESEIEKLKTRLEEKNKQITEIESEIEGI